MARKTDRQILNEWAKKAQDREVREAVRERFGEHRAVFIFNDGKLDVEATLQAIDFNAGTGTEVDGAMNFTDAVRALAPAFEADPVSGEPLLNGKTQGRIKVDWNAVSRERREVAAYARYTSQLPYGATSEVVSHALTQTPLLPPWSRLEQEWQRLVQSQKPDDLQMVASVRALLTFQREARTDRRPFDREPVVVQRAENVTPSTGPVRVHIVASQADSKWKESLLLHMNPMRREGLVKLSSTLDVPAGQNTQAYLALQLAQAEIVVLLMSVHLLNDPGIDIQDIANRRLEKGGPRVVPLVVSPVQWRGSPIGTVAPLLRDDRAVSQYADKDEAFLEAVVGLRRAVMEIMSKRKAG